MKIPFFRHFNPVTQMFGIMAFFFMGILLTDLVIKLLILFIWKNGEEVTLSTETLMALSRIKGVIGVLLVFLAPSTIFRRLMEFEGQDYLRVRKAPGLKTMVLVLALIVPCFYISNFLFFVNNELDPSSIWPELGRAINAAEAQSGEGVKAMYVEPNIWKYLLSIFTVALLTAIGEEFLFRGIIMRLFVKMLRNVHAAVIFSALIFALIHGSYYGMLSRIFMGLVLGYLYLSTGNIWHSIFFHFLNNAFIITFYWLESLQYNVKEVSEFGYFGNSRWVALALLAALTVFVFMRIRKYIRPDFVQEIKDY